MTEFNIIIIIIIKVFRHTHTSLSDSFVKLAIVAYSAVLIKTYQYYLIGTFAIIIKDKKCTKKIKSSARDRGVNGCIRSIHIRVYITD